MRFFPQFSLMMCCHVEECSKAFNSIALGCSRKNPHLPDRWDSVNSRRRGGGGGSQRLWKSRREGGLNLRKFSAGVISTDSSCNSNV